MVRRAKERRPTTTAARILAPLPLALAIQALSVAPAATASDKIIREEFSFTLEDWDAHGMTVDITVTGSFRDTIHDWAIEPGEAGSNDFWIGNLNRRGSELHTDVATGEAIIISWVSNVKEATFVDIGGGFYENTFAESGKPIRIDGQVTDAGRVSVTDTIYFGDLSTQDDDYFAGGVANMIAGPQPAYDGQFCDLYLAALGLTSATATKTSPSGTDGAIRQFREGLRQRFDTAAAAAFLRRGDVLVDPEEVSGVVLPLDLRQPVVVLAV
jgi:hypothetical protein